MQHPFLAMDRSGRYIHYHAAWGIVPLRPDESAEAIYTETN